MWTGLDYEHEYKYERRVGYVKLAVENIFPIDNLAASAQCHLL